MNSKKSIFAAVMGVGLEYYDVMLYTHFLFILSPLFFPSDNPTTSTLLGMISFAAGFIMRPVGGIVFGHFGDRFGRRKSMAFSIMIVTIPTLTIGLLPSYHQIGLAAPIILMLCRFMQSFCIGGEAPGASIFIVEHARKNFKCTASSFINIALLIGSIIGTSLGFFMTQSFMPDWAWRLPFFFGALFGWIGYYIRYKISESPEFLKVQRQKEVSKVPLFEVIKKDRLSIFLTMGICAAVMAPFQVVFVYGGHILKNQLNLQTSEVMACNTLTMTLTIGSLIIMGYLGDRFGKKQVMGASTLGFVILSYPLFHLVGKEAVLFQVLIFQVVMGLLWAGVAAPCNAFVTYLFPTSRRYSGIAFSWAMGSIIFAGMTPLLSMLLTTWLGDEKAPALLLMLCGALGFLAVRNSSKINIQPYEEEVAPIVRLENLYKDFKRSS